MWDIQVRESDKDKWSSWFGRPTSDKQAAIEAYERIVKNKGRVAKNVRLVEVTYSVIRDDLNYVYGTN